MLNQLANIPPDKCGHFIAGLLIYAPLHFIDPVVGLIGAAVAAVGKEVYDYLHRGNHTPDVWDAVATMLGGLVGFAGTM
jgi:hypothetical protein